MTSASRDGAGPEILAEARGVERVYTLGAEQLHALRGVDMHGRAGEFIALIGRSGSGKTTLLNILAGLDRATAGEAFLAGQRLNGLSEEGRATLRRQHVGIVFQSSSLMPLLTAAENVELPLRISGWSRKDREERAREVMDRVGLVHRMRHRPYELSGGEQQRVGIARAIASRPSVLMADEPTGELDSVSAQTVFTLFRSLVEEEKVLIIAATHDRAIMSRADRVLELRDGLLTRETTQERQPVAE